VGEGDVFSRKEKTYLLPYSHKNFGIVYQDYNSWCKNLEGKLHNMSGFTNTVFGNIASISEARRAC
jgi:hypothetical protein